MSHLTHLSSLEHDMFVHVFHGERVGISLFADSVSDRIRGHLSWDHLVNVVIGQQSVFSLEVLVPFDDIIKWLR